MQLQLNSIPIYVQSLDSALAFYVDKLGFRVHTDILIGPDQRWVLLSGEHPQGIGLLLIPVEGAELMTGRKPRRDRKEPGGPQHLFSCGLFRCTNLQLTYERLKAKGVQFVTMPGEGFLGQYEASFIDDSGNWFRLTEDSKAV
ncbi:MAG TPA: VOC family protein [Chitinophagaceae bacterium]|nr:VOC family protein [Chitinophagaceae bacterium]